jgi:outer membrane protein OmpA-like peptidoglycan-associated protein
MAIISVVRCLPASRRRGLAGMVWLAWALLSLGGCAGTSALDELNGMQASGSPFTKALFNDYAYLAHSLAGSGVNAPLMGKDSSLFGDAGSTETLAETFAGKAVRAAHGEEVPPEPAPVDVRGASGARDELMRLLEGGGRERAPAVSAHAQAGFDCWVLNARIPGQGEAAETCRRTFDSSTRSAELTFAPPVAAAPTPMIGPQESFTAYFGWDEWALSGTALQSITQAVQAAHDGRQSHIDIVGHTDTSGSAKYNQALSERRASVVRDVMEQMGARAEAVSVQGVGEAGLAVQTADGVREPKNRRSVITLIP